MLSETAIAFLSPLRHKANAERRSCILPLGGIYWEDEIPDFQVLLKVPEDDRNLIYRLFSIGFKIWESAKLSEGDQDFWDSARLQVPNYPLFQRLVLSADDRQAQTEAERNAMEGFQGLFAEADKVEVSKDEHGLASFKVTFDLTKDHGTAAGNRTWWNRILNWLGFST